MNNGAGAALAAKVQQKIGINKKNPSKYMICLDFCILFLPFRESVC